LAITKGAGWRGFHHHATLYRRLRRIAAYGFLIAERGALPPQDRLAPRSCRDLPFPAITDPEAPPIRPERHCAKLDCHHAAPSHRRPRPDATEMPLLQRADPQNPQNSRLLTQ
jgi:hypothetical protein